MTLVALLVKNALLIVSTILLVATCSFWAVYLLQENLVLQAAAAGFSGAKPIQ